MKYYAIKNKDGTYAGLDNEVGVSSLNDAVIYTEEQVKEARLLWTQKVIEVTVVETSDVYTLKLTQKALELACSRLKLEDDERAMEAYYIQRAREELNKEER